jgi:Cu(I)/Ag(I) efflux system membrane fusion protein
MNRRIILSLCGGLAVLAAIATGAYHLGARTAARGAVPAATAAATDKAGRKILYWHDPMVPAQKFDKPGKSPFMDMDLAPVYADDAGAGNGVAVDPGIRQHLGIRVVEVRKGALAATLDLVGNVAFNERDLVLLQARAGGYVEKLFVRAPLDPVRKGQPLVELSVPDWVAAQEDYFAIKRMPAGGDTAGLLDAALQRMRLAGMTDEQVRQVRSRSRVSPHITVTAPLDGVVSELAVREGMTVTQGAPLFRINGLRTVWVNAEVPESAAAQVRPGMAVRATSPAFPGSEFTGKVEALLPEVNAVTRTLKARIVLANPGAKLAPGMFATVHMAAAQSRESLLVPTEAVIQTGTRSVVITVSDEGRFVPADVVTGAEANGQTEVVRGLDVGRRVVASGQFLIDSEAGLRASLQRLGGGSAAAVAPAPAPAPPPAHHASGTVERITAGEVTISHGPVPTLNWGPMTMGFTPPPGGLPADIRVGDSVRFDIRRASNGKFAITAISRRSDAGARSGK